MNEAIRRFVDELAADPAVRGVILFGSHARGNARPDSDADLVILVEPDQFEMGFAELDGQKFELLRWSEAVAIRYATDNPDNAADFWQVAEILHDPDGAAARLRDHAAEMLAEGKPPMDEARRAWSRWASDDRLDGAAGIAEDDPVAARVVLHERVIDLTATFFDVRGEWTPPTKRRTGRIAALDPGLHGLLTAFYTGGTSFADQLALARQMLPLIYDDAGTRSSA
jgi:Nucleotidyltransferase domain